eukprot:scaffold3239_cov142-Isochrysis_galbana.AAC.3
MASAPRPTGNAQAAVAAFGGARWKRRPFAEYQAAIDAHSARQEAPLAMAAKEAHGRMRIPDLN